MNKFLWLGALLLSALFATSCKTFSGTPQIKPDYTDEQIRLSEAENIRRMIPNSPVKALWLSELLVEKSALNALNTQDDAQNMPDEVVTPADNAVKTLFADCVEAVRQDMEKAVSDGQWYTAEKLCKTLLCVCGDDAVAVEKQATIQAGLAEKTVATIRNANDTANTDFAEASEAAIAPQTKNATQTSTTPQTTAPKTSDFIKGTVTIWVDKGVTVQNRVGYSEVALGSGFFIDEGGSIITNYHVIQSEVDPKYEGYSRLYIKLAGKSDDRIPAKVLGWDASCDLALLKADVKPGYVFELGSASDLEVGDRILAVGAPLGLEHTVTSGIISAVERDVGMPGKVIQIDAAVNSGNSGGPVVDENGKVQGVVFAGLLQYQGLNFVIPVETLKAELPALSCGGEVIHPWIGITGRTKKVYPSDEEGVGVEVLYVLPAGIADYADINPGDVICSFDGVPVKDMDDLHNAMIPAGTDRIVEIGLWLGDADSVATDGADSVEAVEAAAETPTSPQNSTVAPNATVAPNSTSVQNSTAARKTVKIYLEKRPEYPGYTIYQNDLLYKAFYPLTGMELVPVSSASVGKYAVKSVVKGSVADESGFADGDPVEIISAEAMPDKSYLYVEVYAKKRRKGYLDVTLGFAVPLDSTSFF